MEMKRETIRIVGERNLYSYTFDDPQSELLALISSGESLVPFLEAHPGLDLAAALERARELGRDGAVRELESR